MWWVGGENGILIVESPTSARRGRRSGASSTGCDALRVMMTRRHRERRAAADVRQWRRSASRARSEWGGVRRCCRPVSCSGAGFNVWPKPHAPERGRSSSSRSRRVRSGDPVRRLSSGAAERTCRRADEKNPSPYKAASQGRQARPRATAREGPPDLHRPGMTAREPASPRRGSGCRERVPRPSRHLRPQCLLALFKQRPRRSAGVCSNRASGVEAGLQHCGKNRRATRGRRRDSSAGEAGKPKAWCSARAGAGVPLSKWRRVCRPGEAGAVARGVESPKPGRDPEQRRAFRRAAAAPKIVADGDLGRAARWPRAGRSSCPRFASVGSKTPSNNSGPPASRSRPRRRAAVRRCSIRGCRSGWSSSWAPSRAAWIRSSRKPATCASRFPAAARSRASTWPRPLGAGSEWTRSTAGALAHSSFGCGGGAPKSMADSAAA